MQQLPTALNPLAQHAFAGEVRQQKLHLVSQDTAALQVDIFGVRGCERDGQQFHSSLLGCEGSLVIIAALACGDYVDPAIRATLTQRIYMVP